MKIILLSLVLFTLCTAHHPGSPTAPPTPTNPSPPYTLTHIGGNLRQISVGERVWGTNSADLIFMFQPGHGWLNVGGNLKQVVVSNNGLYVWGVNQAGDVFYRNQVTVNSYIGYHWILVASPTGVTVTHLSVSDGNVVYAVASGKLYDRTGFEGNWQLTPSIGNPVPQLKEVSVYGSKLVGITTGDHLAWLSDIDLWITRKPATYKHVSQCKLGKIATDYTGKVNLILSGSIVHTQLPATGSMVQVDCGGNMELWGVNNNELIYRYDTI